MKQSKSLAATLMVCAGLFILTASIAAPILFRPFYYLQIGPLGLEAKTGLSRGDIMQAYDEMMNFCTGLSSEFSTGVLSWSEWGRSHFVDVKGLFMLDLWVMAASGAVLIAWVIAKRKLTIRPYQFRGHSVGFWTGSWLLTAFVIIGGLVALDFGKAFTIFHKIFFPGKDNWIFTPSVDQIITILPETFFMNCGILILVLIIGSCAWLIGKDVRRRKRSEKG